jgi:hypothetical protein
VERRLWRSRKWSRGGGAVIGREAGSGADGVAVSHIDAILPEEIWDSMKVKALGWILLVTW